MPCHTDRSVAAPARGHAGLALGQPGCASRWAQARADRFTKCNPFGLDASAARRAPLVGCSWLVLREPAAREPTAEGRADGRTGEADGRADGGVTEGKGGGEGEGVLSRSLFDAAGNDDMLFEFLQHMAAGSR
jgi:hypothetical protein